MRKYITILFLFLISICFASTIVSAIPSFNFHNFQGKVTYYYNPSMSLTGHEISASVGGYGLGNIGTIETGNMYDVEVDSEGHYGEVIFYIGNVKAEQTAVYEMGGDSLLDLVIKEIPSEVVCGNNVRELNEQCDGSYTGTITCEDLIGVGGIGTVGCTDECIFDLSGCSFSAEPYCGDAVCNNGETCSSCSLDCGSCNTGGSTGGGGGGGSGGSSGSSSSDDDDDYEVLSDDSNVVDNEENEIVNLGSKITGGTVSSSGAGNVIVIIVIGVIVLLFLVIFSVARRK